MYTGNTFFHYQWLRGQPVYPCVYREHTHLAPSNIFDCGLSLCIQGTRRSIYARIVYERFIPVYTGNTLHSGIVNISCAVYPCVYREHKIICANRTGSGGLSLCIQGTRFCATSIRQKTRFIPVYTGNTKSSGKNKQTLPVYPCVYREHELWA